MESKLKKDLENFLSSWRKTSTELADHGDKGDDKVLDFTERDVHYNTYYYLEDVLNELESIIHKHDEH
jgi:hypothetical protein